MYLTKLTQNSYMPKFHFNLIYAYKLPNSLKYKLIFYHGSCVIIKIHSSKMIGHARAKNNLYVCDQTNQLKNLLGPN
ncbi:hypothetical protein CR513_56890, partial [Mucuna pruriens]